MMPTSSWKLPDSFPDISQAKFWSLDVETCDPFLRSRGPGTLRKDAWICGVAIHTEGFTGYYSCRHAVGPNIAPNVLFDWLRDQVKDFRGELYGANLLYDLEHLWVEDVKFHDDVKVRDVQICEPLLDSETTDGYSLEVLSRKYLGVGKEESLLREAAQMYTSGYKDKACHRPINFDPKKDLWQLPPEYVGQYAEIDVLNPRRIYEKQKKLIDEQNLERVLDLESSLTPILLRMRINGVRVDLEQAEKLRDLMSREIDKYSLQIKKLVGFDPNVDSGQDLSKAYNALNFRMPELNIANNLKYTGKGNPSFTADWYSAQQDPLSKAILKKKKLMTMRDDFIVGDILHEHVDGRIHAQFHQLRGDEHGTRDGRFSSTNPNLQQVPARHDEDLWGKDSPVWAELVRQLFIADSGKKFLKADYSQQELRLLVHFASKAKMRGVESVVAEYRKNPKTDYHSVVQGLVKEACGKLYKRRYIKDANFGLVYGMGFAKLCLKLGLSNLEAEEFLKAYHGAIPFAKSLAAKAMGVAQERGYVLTLLCRRCRFDTWEPIAESREERSFKFKGLRRDLAEQQWPGRRLQRAGTHKALNKIIQPSAADQTKQAMHDLYYDHGIVPQLIIHDEFTGSVVDAEEARIYKYVMENCVLLEIPVVADTKLGASWGSTKEEIEL
jgi:DNA polymerase I-like protein with 3'-5' exonuclease and polymerase domains